MSEVQNEKTQTTDRHPLTDAKESKSPLAKMFLLKGKLHSFRSISPDYVEIKVPLPLHHLAPFPILTTVKKLSEEEIQDMGYQQSHDIEWFIGSYSIPCASVEIVLAKQDQCCHYAFL